jgi:hypothetical protein
MRIESGMIWNLSQNLIQMNTTVMKWTHSTTILAHSLSIYLENSKTYTEGGEHKMSVSVFSETFAQNI